MFSIATKSIEGSKEECQMMILLLIMAFIGIGLFEIPGLIQKKYWRELIVFLIFLLFTFVVSILQVMGVQLPNPTKGIEFLVNMVKSIFS